MKNYENSVYRNFLRKNAICALFDVNNAPILCFYQRTKNNFLQGGEIAIWDKNRFL